MVTFGARCTRKLSAGTPQGVVTGSRPASPAMTSWYVYQPVLLNRATGVPTVPDLVSVNVAREAGSASHLMACWVRKGPWIRTVTGTLRPAGRPVTVTLSRLAWPTRTFVGKALVEIPIEALDETWVAVAETRWLAGATSALAVAGGLGDAGREEARLVGRERLAARLDAHAAAGRGRERDLGGAVVAGPHPGREPGDALAVELDDRVRHRGAAGRDELHAAGGRLARRQAPRDAGLDVEGPAGAPTRVPIFGEQALDPGRARDGLTMAGRASPISECT